MKNRKGIAILRVSSHRQKDNASPEVQEKEIRAYAATANVKVERVFQIVESAKDSNARKLYNEAIAWAFANDVPHVLFYMADRESRNFTDIEKNERLVRAGLIELHYAHDRKSLTKDSSDADFLQRDMMALIAKGQSRATSSKVKDTFRVKAESGWAPMNHLPLGYAHQRLRDEDGRELKRGTIVVPDPKDKNVQQAVREFELRALGYSYEQIRDRIVAEGYVSSERVRTFRPGCIERRIKNPFYRGKFLFDGKLYDGKHELIVPPEILARVDEKMGATQYQRRSAAIFGGGWLRCAHSDCGCGITYDPKRKKLKSGEIAEFRYYRCSNGKRAHESLRGMNVTEESLWNQFGDVIGNFTLDGAFAAEVLQAVNEVHAEARRQRQRVTKDYTLALKALEQKEDEIYQDLKSGILDDSAYRRKVETVRAERDKYTRLLASVSDELDDAFQTTAESAIELAKEARSLWVTRSETERKEFLEHVLSNWALDGAIVRYELRKPFAALTLMNTKEEWRPHVGDFRTAILAMVA